MNPPVQQAFRKTPALYIVNLLYRQIAPDVAQGVDRLPEVALMIGDKRRVDGAGGNAGQYGDAQAGKMMRKAAQKSDLVGGMGPSAPQDEGQIVIRRWSSPAPFRRRDTAFAVDHIRRTARCVRISAKLPVLASFCLWCSRRFFVRKSR